MLLFLIAMEPWSGLMVAAFEGASGMVGRAQGAQSEYLGHTTYYVDG